MSEGLVWTPPDSPDSPLYREILALIDGETPDVAEDVLRAVAEADLWFYCWQASSMRGYVIDEPGHRHKGRLWICESLLFDLCRELQENEENARSDVFYNLSRYTFKTTIITQHCTCWETLRDPGMTTAVVTWKVDQVGEKIYLGIKNELEKNEVLLRHWPDVLFLPGEVPDLWTRRALNVKRTPGPSEPTVSIHGMDSLPTSFHARRIVGDDCVTEATIQNANTVKQGVTRLRLATALGGENTVSRWVGTIWKDGDPNLQLLEDGFFTKRYLIPAFDGAGEYKTNQELLEKGTPNLHTKEFWAEWVRKLGFHLAACQLQQRAVAHGEAYFSLENLTDAEYQGSPRDCARGKNVYFIIDQAGEGDKSNYFVIRVVGLGADRHYYELDLWREQGLKTKDLYTLLMGAEEGEDTPPMYPRGGLVDLWKPRLVWVEEFSQGIIGPLRAEMKRRNFNFKLLKLPTVKKRSKEGRISLLEGFYDRGEFHYPAQGFGHGSRHDSRDTYQQFRRDEAGVWVYSADANASDDMLDTDAWLIQPETKGLFVFPRKSTLKEIADLSVDDLIRLQEQNAALNVAPSGWAY